MSNNTKISQFPEVTQLPDNAKIPLVGGNPVNDYVISAENLKNEIGGGIEEAPIDGTQYARKDGTWVNVQSADVDKAYVDEQDGLRMLTSEYVGTGATKTVNNATYATNAGTASQANNASYASNAGQANYASSAGTAGSAGTASYANNAGNANTSNTSSYANQAGNATNDGSGRNIYYTYQTITDNNLQTVSKTVVGSINEVNDIAKGAQKAISKTNYSTLVTYLKSLPSSGLTIGQTIYIETLNVPDVWIFSKSVTFNDYIYVSDNQFIADVIDNNTIVGYFGLSKLETSKINLTDYVPYTGATKNVNLGDYNLNANGLGVDTVTPYIVTNPGEIGWNASQGTFDMHLLNGTILQAGQELHIYGKAVGDINNGDVVQLIGSQGGHLTIKKAVQSEVIVNPNLIIGVSTENILNGNFGYVTNFGEINNVYTSGYAEGDSLYFNITGSTAGTFTNVKPNAPYSIIRLGSVLRAQTGNAENGKIGIRLTYSTKLSDLTDVNGTPLTTTGQILVWDNTKGVHDFTDNINNYLNKTGGTVNGYITASGFTGNGSGLYNIPASGITGLSNAGDRIVSGSNSAIMSSSGLTVNTGATFSGNVGIGTSTPSSVFQVKASTTTSFGGFSVLSSTNTNKILSFQDAVSGDRGLLTISSGNTNRFYLDSGGDSWFNNGYNFGIGTSTPSAKLHIVKTAGSSDREVLIKTQVSDAGNDAFIIGNGTSANGTFAPSFVGYQGTLNNKFALNFLGLIPSTADVNTYSPGAIRVSAAVTSSATDPSNGTYTNLVNKNIFSVGGILDDGTQEYLTVKPNGQTVFGLATNNAKVSSLDGQIVNYRVTAGNNLINVNGSAYTSVSGSGIVNISNNGTALTPGSRFSYLIGGAANGTGNLINYTTAINSISTQAFTATNGGSKLTFETTPNNSVTRAERMVIDQNGRVGIGAASPTSTLQVNGDIRVGTTGTTGTYTRIIDSQVQLFVNNIKRFGLTSTEFAFSDLTGSTVGADLNNYYIIDHINNKQLTATVNSVSLSDFENLKSVNLTTDSIVIGDNNNVMSAGFNLNEFYINNRTDKKVLSIKTDRLSIANNNNGTTTLLSDTRLNISDNTSTLINFERGNCYVQDLLYLTDLKAVKMNITSINEYADNASAIAAGKSIGDVYRTGDILKIVH